MTELRGCTEQQQQMGFFAIHFSKPLQQNKEAFTLNNKWRQAKSLIGHGLKGHPIFDYLCSGVEFSFIQGCSFVSPWHSLICSGLQFSGLSFILSGC